MINNHFVPEKKSGPKRLMWKTKHGIWINGLPKFFKIKTTLFHKTVFALVLVVPGVFLSVRNLQAIDITKHATYTFNLKFPKLDFDTSINHSILVHECFQIVNDTMTNPLNASKSLYNLTNVILPEKSTFWRDASDIASLPRHQYSRSQLITALKCYRIIVSACCRNLFTYLPKFREKINLIVSVFHSYQIIFGESDSVDGTLNFLRNWSRSDPNVVVHTFGKLTNSTNHYEGRINRLSDCRNFLINDARKQNQLDLAKFYLVVDPDVNGNDILTLDNFLSNFVYDWDSWAVMTAAQTSSYYDLWALRSKWVPYDCWRMVALHKELNMTWDTAAAQFVWRHVKRPIPRDHGLIEVDSAFGGFAIYQTKYLKDCAYHSREDGFDLCEHVPFNRCIKRNGGRIFINPTFQNAADRVRK